jgi:hypothetical protein
LVPLPGFLIRPAVELDELGAEFLKDYVLALGPLESPGHVQEVSPELGQRVAGLVLREADEFPVALAPEREVAIPSAVNELKVLFFLRFLHCPPPRSSAARTLARLAFLSSTALHRLLRARQFAGGAPLTAGPVAGRSVPRLDRGRAL